MAEQLQNFGSTTVNESLTDSDTTVTVADGSVFPSSGNFRVNCEDEIMLVTARSGNDLTVTRGAESTTAAAHASGTDIFAVLTAGGLSQAIDDVVNATYSGPDYVQFSLDTEYPTYYWGNSSTGFATALTLAPPTGAQGLIVMWACDYIGGSTSTHRLLSVTYGNQSMTLLNNLANTGGITYHHILDLSSAEDTVLRFTTTRYRAASIVVVWIVGPYAVSLTDSDVASNATSPSALVTDTAGGTGIITGGFASTSMTVPASPGTVLKSAWNPSQGGQAGLTANVNQDPNSSTTVTQSYSGVGNMVSHSYSMAAVTPPTINHHSDVNVTSPPDGAALVYDDASSKWTDGPIILSGTGTPESAVTAPVGALFIRTDGGTSTTLYVKESGTGNTGWVAK